MPDTSPRITQRMEGNYSGADFARQNIIDTFLSFGYQPTESEVAQLVPTAEGTGGYERGKASVAQYVDTKKSEADREANDPMKKFVEDITKRANDLQAQSEQLYGHLQDVLTQAPKLFGNLAPEQIDSYIAPLKRIYDQMGAKMQGDFARRGIAGSSVEANAMTDSNTKFKEDVLNTGLQVGLSQQTAQAQSIQDRLNALFGGANSSFGMAGTGSGQLSTEGVDTTRMQEQLPYFLRASALNEQALQAQLDARPSLWDNIDRGIGTASAFMNFAGSVKDFTGGNDITKILGGGGGKAGAAGAAGGATGGGAGSSAIMVA